MKILDQLPATWQVSLNWSAVGSAVASFFQVIQGPIAVIASLLSAVWLGLQIYGWFEKRRNRRP